MSYLNQTNKPGPPPIVYILFAVAVGFGVYHWVNPKKVTSNQNSTPVSVIQASPPNPSDAERSRLSTGEKILITADATQAKQMGTEAFAIGDLALAMSHFQESLKKSPNDPETRIYLNNAQALQGDPLKIAVSVPIGGNLNVAQEILRGVAQTQEKVNRSGGILGRLLVVAIANDQNSPQVAQDVAYELIKDPQVLAVVGHNASEVSLAVAPLYQQAGLVMISPTSGAKELTNLGTYIFRTVPNVQVDAINLAHYATQTAHQSKFTVCTDSSSPYAQSLGHQFNAEALKAGGKISRIPCDFSDPNLTPITVINDSIADGAEGLLMIPSVSKINRAVELAKANEGRLDLYSGSTLNTYQTLQFGKGDVNGMVLAVAWHPEFKAGEFTHQATQMWGGSVNWRTAMAYDAAEAIITGLKRGDTRVTLQQILRDPNFVAPGSMGEIRFQPSGDRVGSGVIIRIQPGNKSGTGYDFVPVTP